MLRDGFRKQFHFRHARHRKALLLLRFEFIGNYFMTDEANTCHDLSISDVEYRLFPPLTPCTNKGGNIPLLLVQNYDYY